jgi:glycosyltransferase involved in cell wall biosynthesis
MKLSILIPTLNSEKYISECFDSLSKQRVTDFDIFVCDGGSKDNTKSICESYFNKFAKVTFLSLVGASIFDAICGGLVKADGDYVAIIDSDDFAEPDLYSTLLDNAEKFNCDISACLSSNNGNIPHILIPFGFYDKQRIEKLILPKSDANCQGWGCVYHSIIFKRELALQNLHYFQNLPDAFCDTVFFFSLLLDCNCLYLDNKALYQYRYNPSSATNVINLKRDLGSLVTYKALAALFKDKGYSQYFGSTHCVFYTSIKNILFDYVKICSTKKECLASFKALISDPFVNSCFQSGVLKGHPNISKKDLVINHLIRRKRYNILYKLFAFKARHK